MKSNLLVAPMLAAHKTQRGASPATDTDSPHTESHPRRRFFQILGGAIGLPLAGCATMGGGSGVNLGSGDIGIMNYALALEGLEAAFYTMVMNQRYSGMTREENQVLRDIRDHEIVHREFFRAALGSNAIPELEYNFSTVNFSDRTSVLTTAMTFEDLGVSAYNGAGSSIKDPAILTLAGKIVSVEARHAATIRDLLYPNSGEFAPTALDASTDPHDVLRKARPYFITKLNGSNLPS